jgi:hypothetical protein
MLTLTNNIIANNPNKYTNYSFIRNSKAHLLYIILNQKLKFY